MYVLVVTSRIAPPTMEEFLLPLLKPCKNVEKNSFPERMEAVKNIFSVNDIFQRVYLCKK